MMSKRARPVWDELEDFEDVQPRKRVKRSHQKTPQTRGRRRGTSTRSRNHFSPPRENTLYPRIASPRNDKDVEMSEDASEIQELSPSESVSQNDTEQLREEESVSSLPEPIQPVVEAPTGRVPVVALKTPLTRMASSADLKLAESQNESKPSDLKRQDEAEDKRARAVLDSQPKVWLLLFDQNLPLDYCQRRDKM